MYKTIFSTKKNTKKRQKSQKTEKNTLCTKLLPTCPQRSVGGVFTTLAEGWDVVYVDGSKSGTEGVEHAGYVVWFLDGAFRNVTRSVPMHGRTEGSTLQHKQPGVPLHIITDSQLVFLGLTRKCEKWQRHKWVGSQDKLSHRHLWQELWESWKLFGESCRHLVGAVARGHSG